MESNEFAARRQRLMELIGQGSMAILPTAPVSYRNRDVEYPYRPDSNFYYLTGFSEPEAVAVLVPGREQGEYLLFCRERNEEQEAWHGYRAGLEGACEIHGADDAFPITDVEDILPGLMENCQRLYYAMGCYPEFDQKILDWLNQLRAKSRSGVHVPEEIVTLERVLHEMRLIKSEAEQEAMRRAVAIAMAGHRQAMRACRPGLWEYQIEAELRHTFMQQGARFQAYPAIVGGGSNGCVLHYTENDSPLRDGELLLIDAGAELAYYASDISRTFPINGRFSPAQKTLYELVLKAQLAAIEQIRPGRRWCDPHDTAVRTITEGLVDIGLLQGEVGELIENEGYKRFYMHRIGHWLGMDVHDVGEYKKGEVWREFQPGMTLTVEPGLYIAAAEDVPRQWWNIGIRIEDNVLVTKDGCEVLSADLPKTVADIEALMAEGK